MHLIHKLRRSISHRPRHLLDLPDEILCLILEYCCQDLDFLLWSCPLVTLEDQFCHDCYHCTLCHGPAIHLQDNLGWNPHRRRAATMNGPGTTQQTNTANMNSNKNSPINSRPGAYSGNNKDHGPSSRDHAGLRKRRKRLPDFGAGVMNGNGGIRSSTNTDFTRITASRQHHMNRSSSPTLSSANCAGTRPCPRNGNRLWCQHLQQQQRHRFQDGSIRLPLLWRLLAPISDRLGRQPHHPQFHGQSSRSLWPTSIRPCIPAVGLAHITSMSSSLIKLLQYPRWGALDRLIQPLNGGQSETEAVPSNLDAAQSTGSNLGQQSGLNRRRTRSMVTHPCTAPPGTPGLILPPGYYSGDADSLDESVTSDQEDDGNTSEENRDDFDDSIHLAAPFQFLLVSRQFADAAAQSLWRNLVFHGHDAYQMQSLLTTLYKDDGLSDSNPAVSLGKSRPRPPSAVGFNSLQELTEEDDDEKGFRPLTSHSMETRTKTERTVVDVLDTLRSHSGMSAAAAVDSIYSSGSMPPFSIQRNNLSGDNPRQTTLVPDDQGLISNNSSTSNRGRWIDSLNGSLKRFSRFQGGLDSNTERLSSSFSSSSYDNDPSSHTGSTDGVRKGSPFSKTTIRSTSRSQLQSLSPWPRPHQAKWPYRRHVRRVVLNFAHPQASPQSLVKVLECLRARCPDQIHALDLHANEKMQDAGLENPEELNRLFGTGFSKLRYVRLQGGFVDNRLLCALINGLRASSEAKASRSRAESSPSSPFSRYLDASPLTQIPTSRLSQVFLGPGSVTNSAIEKLIAATGHSLEVFTVTSCVDVGGMALANLLTKCPRLRVLAVHRSLAQDRELLEGLGIELEGVSTVSQNNNLSTSAYLPPSSTQIQEGAQDTNATPKKKMDRKAIVAPLERLELGTVKLTKVGVSEILKGTCKTLRFLVLETQHFSEDFLTEVITPFCTQLEGLYFDDPEQLQRQQQQLQGLGFSAGRRRHRLQGDRGISSRTFAPQEPDWGFQFGRSGRTFYSDPSRPTSSPRSPQPSMQQRQRSTTVPLFASLSESAERASNIFSERRPSSLNVSAWLGETTTEEWIEYGDCALWTCAAGPGVSFENGGPFSSSSSSSSSTNGNTPGGFRTATPSQQRRSQQPLPLHHVYHNPGMIMSSRYSQWGGNGTGLPGGAVALGGGGGTAADPGQMAQMYQNPYHSLSYIGEYDEILARFRVSRLAIDSTLEGLARMRAFTVMQMDFILESQGLSEWKTMIRQDEAWVQSMGFKALQLFFLWLFLSTIYLGTLQV
ncbi:hypothetical protein EMPS_07015 [Entomortierella parvispora]|uniref:Uncharacterized protein n=1 Tax=Entomortierella parvispora TaxID=205924 RepID=A0A9P3HE32_9FUNG|nr:hypothetical protein EMPS_07015 [Entomortierella parvispora]